PRPATLAVIALNALLVISAFGTISDARWRLTGYVYGGSPGDPFAESPVVSRNGPVTNIYPYAADGTPLEGVLLFDQDGRPLATGTQHWFANGCSFVPAPPLAADGVPVVFSYPKAYVLNPSLQTRSGAPPAPGQCGARLQGPSVPLPTFAPKPRPEATTTPTG
ncbi:MAG: hypothetical protein ABIO67_10220, partial [Mycobacteriales bacterium]